MFEEQKYILDRIREGEGLNLDFKHSIGDAKKIARSLVAFANTDGGSLLIGVRDNGSIAGISTEEEYYMIETASIMHCKPVVEFKYKNWVINGKTILEIIVNKSGNKPHYAPDTNNTMRVFVRRKDKNLAAPRALIEAWKYENKGLGGTKLIYDDVVEYLLSEISEYGSITKSHFVRLTGIKSFFADRLLAKLILMEIIDVDITEQSTKYVFNENYKKDFI
jgi:predicted HTH transcriptional regulator